MLGYFGEMYIYGFMFWLSFVGVGLGFVLVVVFEVFFFYFFKIWSVFEVSINFFIVFNNVIYSIIFLLIKIEIEVLGVKCKF